MNYRTITCFLFVLSLFSCKNEPEQKPAAPLTTADELRLLREKLQAKSAELQDKQQIAEIEKQLNEVENRINQVDGIAPKPAPQPVPIPTRSNKYKINATNVIMRGGSSVQAEKIGTFNLNETVEVVSIVDAENPNESILKEEVELSANGQSVVLSAGKAVMVEKYDQQSGVATIAYNHSTKGKLYAEVDGEVIDLISFSRWYQIKRANGEKGWVFGKFLSPI